MAFDEIAGISAAEESVRLDIAEAQAEAKRIVAQAELAGKTDVEQARDKAAKELAARRAEAPGRRLIRKHRRSIRKRRTKKLCFVPRPKAVVRLRLN